MASNNEFLKLIKKQRKVSSSKSKFKGTFLEYLALIKDNPGIVKTSHRRLYDAITDRGVAVMEDSDKRKSKIFEGDNLKIYDYFQEEFEAHSRCL